MPTTATMDSLPFEIKYTICGSCSITDLKSLRATAKAFVSATTPLLFQRFYMAMLMHDLDRLVAVSNHPQISTYVREFIFDTTLIPTISDPQQWEISIDSRPPLDLYLDLKYNKYKDTHPANSLALRTVRSRGSYAYKREPRHSFPYSTLRAAYAEFKMSVISPAIGYDNRNSARTRHEL